MSPTREQVEAAASELEYINYRSARDEGEPQVAIVAFFGAARAKELEAQYLVELAERKAETAADELQGRLSPAEIVL
jgi:hypothetical protein